MKMSLEIAWFTQYLVCEKDEDWESAIKVTPLTKHVRCFLCLSNVAETGPEGGGEAFGEGSVTTSQRKNCSFLNLNDYLQINVDDIYKDPSETKLEKSVVEGEQNDNDLSVCVCEGCATFIEQFSEHYKQLELIRVQINSCLGTIRQKIVEGNQNKIIYEAVANSNVIEWLRNQIELKCTSELETLSSRVKLKRTDSDHLKLESFESEKVQSNSTFNDGKQNENDPNTHSKVMGKGSYQCPVCSKSFDEESSLQTHVQIFHEDSRTINIGQDNGNATKNPDPEAPECELVKVEISSDYVTVTDPFVNSKTNFVEMLPEYKLKTKRKRFKCGQCNKAFKFESMLHMHLSLCCSKCHKSFAHRSSLIRHEKLTCQTNSGAQLSADNRNSNSDKSFDRQPNLKRNKKLCQSKSSSDAPLVDDNKRSKSHSSNSSEFKFKCKYCELALSSNHNLQRHILTVHMKQRFYFCDTCHVTFTQKGSLNRHLKGKCCMNSAVEKNTKDIKIEKDLAEVKGGKTKHQSNMASEEDHVIYISGTSEGNPPFPQYACSMCHQRYRTRKLVTLHYQKVHLDKQYFECEQCHMTFTSYHGRQNHINIMHRGKQYSCNTCNLHFTYRSTLLLHRRKMHCDSSKKVTQVDSGGSSAASMLLESNREVVGANDSSQTKTSKGMYKCQKCNRKFSKLVLLRRHYSSAHTEITYKCDKCNQAYRHNTSLYRHKRLSCPGVKKIDNQEPPTVIDISEEHILPEEVEGDEECVIPRTSSSLLMELETLPVTLNSQNLHSPADEELLTEMSLDHEFITDNLDF